MLSEIAPALPLLQSHGYSEVDVMTRSPQWVTDTVRSVVERENHRQAARLSHTFLAVAAGMGSEEAHTALQQSIADLTRPLEEPSEDDYFVDPNAKGDWTAITQSPLYQGVSQ